MNPRADDGKATGSRTAADYKLNGQFFRRLLTLAVPYWTGPNAPRAWLTFMAFMSFTLGEALIGGKISELTRTMTDALVGKHELPYWNLLIITTLLGLIIPGGPVSFVAGYLTQWLTQDWRRMLTRHVTGRYLEARTYFRIEQDGDIDNVDQRIHEETGQYCSMMVLLPQIMFYTFSGLSVQGWILLHISSKLFFGVLAYGFGTALLSWWMYGPMIRYSFASTMAEADLRYGLLHVRTHAETVALYRGETAEARSIHQRLDHAVRMSLKVSRYGVVLNSIQALLGSIWTLVPVVVLAPMYFSGHISFGVISQGTASAALLLAAISRFTGFIPQFAYAAPHVVRVAQVLEKAQRVRSESLDSGRTIAFAVADKIEFDAMTLETPGRERVLLRDLTLQVQPSENLLVIGRTGVGKSSLLRAMAGLWRSGSGTLAMPPADDVLFLPQRPYMLLGTLREQLLYPGLTGPTDAELQRLLEAVSLPDLAVRHGGFDTVIEWSRILSLGEQQRIGFARVLASGCKYVVLDEATSAVDLQTERLLYELLSRRGITCISVGHRVSIFSYHSWVIEIQSGGAWRCISVDQAQAEAMLLET